MGCVCYFLCWCRYVIILLQDKLIVEMNKLPYGLVQSQHGPLAEVPQQGKPPGLRQISLLSSGQEDGGNALAFASGFQISDTSSGLYQGLPSNEDITVIVLHPLLKLSLSRLFSEQKHLILGTQLRTSSQMQELLRKNIWRLLCSRLDLDDHFISL